MGLLAGDTIAKGAPFKGVSRSLHRSYLDLTALTDCSQWRESTSKKVGGYRMFLEQGEGGYFQSL